eukprot:c12306_g2_i1 orf=290-1948(-)
MERTPSMACRSSASYVLPPKLFADLHSVSPIADDSPSFYRSRLSMEACSASNILARPSSLLRGHPGSLPPVVRSQPRCRRALSHVPVAAASDASLPLAASDASPPFHELLSEHEAPFAVQYSPAASFLSSKRMKVVALVASAMALCNADRVIMSVAIVRLSSLYNWSTSFSGIVQSSFLWGYMISPIVGGALVDRYGGKTVMAYGVGFWSLATFLTPWAARHSVFMLFAVRVLMGLAEGVAMPCMNNMVSRWFPRSERARAIGLTMAGFHLGSVVGLLATPVIMAAWGVSMPFIAFGLTGALWLLFWICFVSNDPEDHPNIEEAELQYIQQNRVPISKRNMGTSSGQGLLLPVVLLLKKLPSWAVIVANFTNNWGYFVLLSWMPIYFNSVYGVNLKQAAWFSAVPWAMMAAVGCVAGSCSDFLIESGLNITTVRKIMQSIGFMGPALALIAVNASSSASVAAVWLTVAIGSSSFSQAGFLVNFQEIAPRHAGLLQGISNTVGTIGAIFSTIGIGYFIQWLGSFQAFLTLTAAFYVLSTLFWNIYATGERVIE